MKKQFVILAVAVFVTASTVYASPDIHRGMMLMDARAALFKAGWHGIILHEHPGANSSDDDYLDANATVFYKAGIKEIDSCTNGLTQCQTHYRKGKDCLTLNSVGETPHDAFITHRMNTCGD